MMSSISSFLVPLCISVWLFGGVVASAETATELIASKNVLIRARVEPVQIFVGQKAKLSVDVMTKTWFLEAPAFPDVLDVGDAIVIPPGPFGVNSSKVVDGERYVVQTKSYSIIPTGVGAYRVPPFEVPLVVAQENASRSPSIVMTTPELSFEVTMPAKAQGLGLVVSTPQLDIGQQWSRSFEGLKVGDSITRTITQTIEDSAAMLVPVPEFTTGEGVSLYQDRPSLNDERNRGEMRGRRIDQVVYTFEKEGAFDLPEIVIHWWDLDAGKLRREVLSAVDFEVEASPELVVETFGAEEEESVDAEPRKDQSYPLLDRARPLAVAALILVVSGWLLRRPLGAIGTAWTEHRRVGAEEKRRFGVFRKTARKGEAGSTVRALIAWLDIWRSDGEPGSLELFVSSTGDPVLEVEIAALESAAFAASESDDQWSPSGLVRRVAAARAKGRRRQYAAPSIRELPFLNPR